MNGKEKNTIIEKIKKLIYATEEQKESEEEIGTEEKPIMEEIFNKTEEDEENKVADIVKIRKEKEEKEKEEAAKKIKEEIKAEIKEELKAEKAEKKEKEETEEKEESVIESILETVIKEVKEEKYNKEKEKEKAQNKKREVKIKKIKKKDEKKEESNNEALEERKEKQDPEKNIKKEKSKTEEEEIEEANTENENISYTITLTKKELEKAIKKAEKRQNKLIKQQINEEKKLIKQRKLEETLSENALKSNNNSQGINKKFKIRMFIDFINDKSDEYAPEEIIAIENKIEEKISDEKDSEEIEKKEKKAQLDNKEQQKSEETHKVPVVNIPIAKDVKKAEKKTNQEEQRDTNKNKEKTIKKDLENKRSRNLFEKPHVKRLSESDLEKLLINGQKVPEYVYENDVYKITLASNKITSCIKKEYEEYIKEEVKKEKQYKKIDTANVKEDNKSEEISSKKEKASSNNSKNKQSYANKPTTQEEEKDEHRSIKEKLFGSYRNVDEYSDFSPFREEKEEVIEDYESSQDARSVRAEISMIARKLTLKSIVTGIIFLISLSLTVLQKFFPELIIDNVPNADIMVSVVNIILIVIGISVCHSAFFNGLKPLIWFKGNEDTAVAIAAVAVFAQCFVAVFESSDFFALDKNLYLPIVLLALFLNCLGKVVVQLRIKDNFNFISTENRKYTAKIFDKHDIAKKMLDDNKINNPIIAYQIRTQFLSKFLKLSYTPDPSQSMAAKLAPVCTILAIVIGVIYGIVYNNPADATSAITAILCVSIPVCSMLAVNLPMKRLCKKAVKLNSMIVGYPAVKEFANTSAVMVDARELYPRGKVELISVKIFDNIRADKAFIKVSAVLKMANTSLTYMFEDIITDKNVKLPHVDTVKYEDGKGLLSWVNGERILIGNRELMKKYKVNLPSIDYEERNKDKERYKITYIASSGNVIAMLVTNYKTTKNIITELKSLEKAGVTLLVSTTDPNITQESISKDFELFYRTVKILPTDLSNICKEEISIKEKESTSYIATRGRVYSLIRAITSCIRIKNNISIAIAIQSVSIILGLILISTIALTAGLSGLGAFELLLYVGFWAIATVVAPLLRKI